ncbi:hypothetical protein [Aristaeella hokkaidonensis]|uniref:Uncharacterized protein n=1 Tax=Aristaeella hokkaidonensis TaxID=3046382 RepID=A0AC61N5E8_9FIRM|nr:hypothetical protein [Aristaeella hokkaidonensis]QUC66168.1 hypothetical protein JYE49_09835 [Aristaeella hokkaidonensis]SNT94825.1 hypothetical protein SAMN06297421_10753 [Aristaeella hokkaidonensis]
MMTADWFLNILIALITLIIVVSFFRKEGQWVPERGKFALRFFTTLSNMLCAAACLLTALAINAGGIPEWIWMLKYIGTAAVTVTMLTVLFFLAPTFGKGALKVLLSGTDLFMHLITPLLALVSFCVFERRGMTFCQSLWGMLPVVLYGPVYLYKILFALPEKRWDDFYGFNKQGKWPVAFAGMVIGTFLICMGIMALQNL